MTQHSVWISYNGPSRMLLAIVLLLAAAAVAVAGTRLRLPVRLPRPGPKLRNAMLTVWAVSLVAFMACFSALAQLERQDHLVNRQPANPITPVTFTAAGVIFLVILAVTRGRDWPARLAAAATGAMAAPMIFEVPFDLIVMTRVDLLPAGAWALLFVPLFCAEITTLSLLALSGLARISRATFFAFAVVLAVFAVWALSGFGYPSAPLPYALNVISKIGAFVTALTLFLPRRAWTQAQAGSSRPVTSSASATARSFG